MAVTAKFYVSTISQFPGQPGGRVELQAVVRGEENRQWSAATPSGTISMNISNPAAFETFQALLVGSQTPGGPRPEVLITFEPTPAA